MYKSWQVKSRGKQQVKFQICYWTLGTENIVHFLSKVELLFLFLLLISSYIRYYEPTIALQLFRNDIILKYFMKQNKIYLCDETHKKCSK